MDILFQPIALGSMTVSNRFVRSATHDYIGGSDGTLSEAEFALYRELAQNGTGLIITAHGYVSHPLGRGSINQNGIYDDRFIDGYRRLAETVQSFGSKLVVQISHAGRQTPPDWDASITPVAPSAVADPTVGIEPRALTDAEIWQLIDDFVAAMVRVKKAGCDGVQLHIAHGYLLSQFLSPYTNKRTDNWGGSLENRTRIIKEIICRGRKLVGCEFPVLVKLNSTDGFAEPGYLSLEDVIQTAKMLESWGVDAIELSGGIREAKGVMSRPGIKDVQQEAYFAPAAKAVKAAVSIPVILVGGLRSRQVMEQVITEKAADMVALSRPFVKQPDLVRRFREGAAKVECVSCNACFNPKGLRCYLEAKTNV